MLGGAGRGEGDRARYDLPCRVSRSELASGARSQESPTKHHAKLGSWGPSDALPYPAYPHPKVPGGEASGHPSCTTHPLLPSQRAAQALVPQQLPRGGGPWGQTDGPRVLECLWTMGGGLVGKGLSLDG